MLMVASGAMLAQLLGLDPIDSRVEGFRRKEPVRFLRRQRQQNTIAKTTKAIKPMTTPAMMLMLLSLRSWFGFVDGVDVDVDADVDVCL